jgi:hemerythrin-like domain-containing protein
MNDMAQRLQDEHDALRHHQQRLRDCLERYQLRSNRDNLLAFRDLFESFAGCLQRHLEIEEADGYLVEVKERRPRKCSDVDKLLAEHDVIREQATALVGALQKAAEGDQALSESVAEDFAKFMEVFAHHEAAERELVLDAFWRDGGRSRSGLEQ